MKRVMPFLCVMFIFSCSKSTYVEVHKYKYNKDGNVYFTGHTEDGMAVLMDSKLHKILPAYSSIGSICNEAIWVNKDKKWGMVDYRNRIVIPFEADSETGCFEKGIMVYSKDKMKGARNNKGKIVIPFQYDQILVNEGAERIIAYNKNTTDLYDISGKIISSGEYDYIGFFVKGISIIRKNGKLGAIDYQMNIVCEPIYDNIGKFETDDEIAWVVLNKKIGYVNKDFEVIIPIKYDDGTVFANGMVRVKKNEETVYLNRDSKQIFPTEQEIKDYETILQKIQASYDSIRFSS